MSGVPKSGMYGELGPIIAAKGQGRPRREGTNYDPQISPDPLFSTRLSTRRKEWIQEFKAKKGNKQAIFGTKVWLEKLVEYMHDKDPAVTAEDVRRWTENHEWILDPKGTPVVKEERGGKAVKATTATAKVTATKATATTKTTATAKDKKVSAKPPKAPSKK